MCIFPITMKTNGANGEVSSPITSKILIEQLMEQKKLPENGWDSLTIDYMLSYLSSMDSNNFISKASVGEREGRCYSDLVAKRSFYFTHGIGRSGDLTEPQPKAAGSSVLYKLTNALLEDLMISYDIHLKCLLAPIPIGISLMLCLFAFRLNRTNSQYVLWFREDNEVILKAIFNAGFIPVILDVVYSQEGFISNFALFQKKINEIGPDKITGVVSTISCTLPRANDDIEEISKICQNYDIPHIVNNDYGLQSMDVINTVKKVHKNGRVDVLLQNAGENFLVPVGSTLIASHHADIIENIAKTYPGRASSNSAIDIFITMLSLGMKGYQKLVANRQNVFQYFKENLSSMVEVYDRGITSVSSNSMSVALAISNDMMNLQIMVDSIKCSTNSLKIKVLTKLEKRFVSNHLFEGWGTHGSNYPIPFIIFQLSLTTSMEEINSVLEILDRYFEDQKNYKQENTCQNSIKNCL